nr:MAG TPA: hypothetical protein [Bacteriophage sp.]
MIYGNYSVVTVSLEQLQNTCLLLRFHKAERSCSPRLEKQSLFSSSHPCTTGISLSAVYDWKHCS